LQSDALDHELKRLHGSDAHIALSSLHEEAALAMPSKAERRFHLTHAWVYALVTGDDRRVQHLESQLKTLGGL
jgi:hypothetical protein